VPTLAQLHEQNKTTKRSFGIVRPDSGSVKFFVKATKDVADDDRAREPDRLSAGVIVQSTAGQAADARVRVRLDMLKQMHGERTPRNNLHFILGTMKAHPRTFIIIGLLRSPVSPDDLDKQPPGLF
jgi:hypothetical protein